MSRTVRKEKPWCYWWETTQSYERAVRVWESRHPHTYPWTYRPWRQHNFSWGERRAVEIKLANHTLRRRTRDTLLSVRSFFACSCHTGWECPLHEALPSDTPDWHPGVVRVGYWD